MTFIEKTNQAKTKNPKIHAFFKKIITKNNEQNEIINELEKILGNNVTQKKTFYWKWNNESTPWKKHKNSLALKPSFKKKLSQSWMKKIYFFWIYHILFLTEQSVMMMIVWYIVQIKTKPNDILQSPNDKNSKRQYKKSVNGLKNSWTI